VKNRNIKRSILETADALDPIQQYTLFFVYEAQTSRWVKLIPFKWALRLVLNHYGRMALRKHRRFKQYIEQLRERVAEQENEEAQNKESVL
jgi:hypothetical protein